MDFNKIIQIATGLAKEEVKGLGEFLRGELSDPEHNVYEQIYLNNKDLFIPKLKSLVQVIFRAAGKLPPEVLGSTIALTLPAMQEILLGELQNNVKIQRYSLVGVVCGIILLPNLWKSDLIGAIETLKSLPSLLADFIDPALISELTSDLPDLMPLLTHITNIPNAPALICRAVVQLIENFGINILYDLALFFMQRPDIAEQIPPFIANLITAPNARQQIVPMLKGYCENAHLLQGLQPGQSLMAQAMTMLKNDKEKMIDEIGKIHKNMDQVRNVINSPHVQQMMSNLLPGVSPEQLQQVQSQTMALLQDPNFKNSLNQMFNQGK